MQYDKDADGNGVRSSLSRRSILKQAGIGGAALLLPTGPALAKYQQTGDSGVDEAIRQHLRDHEQRKAFALAAEHGTPMRSVTTVYDMKNGRPHLSDRVVNEVSRWLRLQLPHADWCQ